MMQVFGEKRIVITNNWVQALAAHINANAEKLRPLFVDHEGKEDIYLDVGQYGDLEKHMKGKASFEWQVRAVKLEVALDYE